MRFHDALALETKKRWRGSDGAMRMASKRQRRNMRMQNAMDTEARLGPPAGRLGMPNQPALFPNVNPPLNRSLPNSGMGLSKSARNIRALRAEGRARNAFAKRNKGKALYGYGVDAQNEAGRQAYSRTMAKLTRLSSRQR